MWFANGLVGNPVSYFIAKSKAEKRVEENYAAEGYVLTDVGYNFKNSSYIAFVEKPNSEDCKFSLSYSPTGKLNYDTYENNMADGGNVRLRLDKKYREFVKNASEVFDFPYSCDGDLVFEGDDYKNQPLGFGLSKDILTPDAQYDIAKLGEQGGIIDAYAETDTFTAEKAAEALLDIDDVMKQTGGTFYSINLTLESDNGEYLIENFYRSDIYEDGLVERVKKNHEETEKFYTGNNSKD